MFYVFAVNVLVQHPLPDPSRGGAGREKPSLAVPVSISVFITAIPAVLFLLELDRDHV